MCQPNYKNECANCRFLGTFTETVELSNHEYDLSEKDLYFCEEHGITVRSGEGIFHVERYYCYDFEVLGRIVDETDPLPRGIKLYNYPFAEAYRRAVQRGFIRDR